MPLYASKQSLCLRCTQEMVEIRTLVESSIHRGLLAMLLAAEPNPSYKVFSMADRNVNIVAALH